MKTGELASILGLELAGNPEIEVTGVSYAETAKAWDIAVAKNKRAIRGTMARAVVTAPCFIHTDKSLLFTWEDLDYITARLCEVFVERGYLTDYSKPVRYAMAEHNIGFGANVAIGRDVVIEPGVLIGDDVAIGDNSVLGSGCKIGSGTRLGKEVFIAPGSVVGAESFFHYYVSGKLAHFKGVGRVVIHDGVHIGSHCVVQRGTISNTVIGSHTMVGNCIDIGHDVAIGKNCKIVSQTGIAGNAAIGDNVLIYGQAGVANGVRIGDNVVVKAKTLVSKSVGDNQTVFGLYGRDFHEEMRLQAKVRRFFERKG